MAVDRVVNSEQGKSALTGSKLTPYAVTNCLVGQTELSICNANIYRNNWISGVIQKNGLI